MVTIKDPEVIIIGGSYAGLSAAMALGRSKRQVLIIDDNNPCNKQTPHSHNFIMHDGETPAEIRKKALQQVLKYDTVTLFEGTAFAAAKNERGFEVKTSSGERFAAKKLLFATGVSDIMPDIKGFAECWGRSVIHCPYCHGYEVKDTPLGIIANGGMAFEFCRMIHHWSKDLILFTNGKAQIAAEDLAKLATHGIGVIEDGIRELHHRDGSLISVELQNGTHHKLNAIFSRAANRQHCTIPEQLGCQLNDHGLLAIDEFHRTNVPGIFAAGDNSSMFRSVIIAAAAGTKAAAFMNKELIEEEF